MLIDAVDLAVQHDDALQGTRNLGDLAPPLLQDRLVCLREEAARWRLLRPVLLIRHFVGLDEQPVVDVVDLQWVALGRFMVLPLVEEAEFGLVEPGVGCILAHMVNALAS